MDAIRNEAATDIPARDALLDRAFGPGRRAKTSERLREGRAPALALVAGHGTDLVGTVRLWHVQAGSAGAALLLGPLAVAESHRGTGLGGALIRHALALAPPLAVLLVGDEAYYRRFGFSANLTAGLSLPGPVERDRFLGLERGTGALAGAHGPVTASGRPDAVIPHDLPLAA